MTPLCHPQSFPRKENSVLALHWNWQNMADTSVLLVAELLDDHDSGLKTESSNMLQASDLILDKENIQINIGALLYNRKFLLPEGEG